MKDYSVAIRTLGTAGEKYQRLLDSLKGQTIPTKDIFVYIPHGYVLPKETIGIEKYIRCEKGMVAQRSLPFDEIKTDYILFCDDDMYLPPDLVEKMFKGITQHDADSVAVSVFEDFNRSKMFQLGILMHSFISPRRNDGWMVKIKRNASYSYNINPQKEFMPTESASFNCFLCKKSVYQVIHYEDERWLDKMMYASGDDQLFFYKMHLMGYKPYYYMNSGAVHLDGQAGRRMINANKMYLQKKNLFVMWYRMIYDIQAKSSWEKFRCVMSFGWRCLFGIFTLPLEVIHYKKLRFFIDYFRGLLAGFRYVRSDDYKMIPPYDAYVNL